MESPLIIEELKDYSFESITRLNCEDDLLRFKAPVLGECFTATIPMMPGVLLVSFAGKPEQSYQLRYSQYFHGKVLISLVLAGEATHSLENNFRAKLNKNQSFIYDVNQDRTLISYRQSKRFEVASLVFDPEVFNTCLDKFFDRGQKKEKQLCINAIFSNTQPGQLFHINNEIKVIVQQILKCRLKRNFRRVFLECKLYEMLAHYFQAVAEPKSKEIVFSAEDIQKMQEIRRLLASENPTEISIEGLCRSFGLNRFKLTTGFQSLFNISVIKFYRQELLKRAYNDLQEKKHTINELSHQYGYNNSAAFSRAFFNEFGIRPSELIHNHRLG